MVLMIALAMEMKSANIEGWTCRVERAVMEDKVGWATTKAELSRQLQNIRMVVPAARLSQVRTVKIWIREKSPSNPAMAYHPSADWLRDHSLDPAMAKGIELGNIANFNAWTKHQPWMVMHELAHAYHDQVLKNGFSNAEISAAFESATASKKYEAVANHAGETVKHYGLNNPMEYFAETTESYFGKNDFYPFTNSELKTFDPVGYQLMQKIWGNPIPRTPVVPTDGS